MAAETSHNFEALSAQAQRLMGVFTRSGYELVAPAIIQPAGLFLDVVGEDLRARTYVFSDPEGAELCLRPDLTVPTCRLHLARHGHGDVPARYCYNGPAFRYQPGGGDRTHPREFRQAGIESFAAANREQADAEVAGLCAEALRDAGLDGLRLRIGDLGLFTALVDALPMPPRWRRRLHRKFWRPDAFRAELTRLTSAQALAAHGLPQRLVETLDPAKSSDMMRLVEAYLAENNIDLIGTRMMSEITERLGVAVADAREAPLPAATALLLEDYVKIRSDARSAAGAIRGLTRGAIAGEMTIRFDAALDAYDRRLALLEEAGVDLSGATFSAEFGRNLEYYTGFVFELLAPQLDAKSPVVGGGRYDSLLADVGAPRPIPAVGASIHTERVLSALGGGAA